MTLTNTALCKKTELADKNYGIIRLGKKARSPSATAIVRLTVRTHRLQYFRPCAHTEYKITPVWSAISSVTARNAVIFLYHLNLRHRLLLETKRMLRGHWHMGRHVRSVRPSAILVERLNSSSANNETGVTHQMAANIRYTFW